MVLPGIVMDQFPKPYSRVKAGRTVRLSISHPERLVEVPNLIGQSKRNGELILQQVGLLLDTVYFEFHPDKKEGRCCFKRLFQLFHQILKMTILLFYTLMK